MRGFIQTACLATLLAVTARATEITLLNGLTLTGEVVSATSEGLAFTSADRSRVYPWFSLAPGSRLRYEPANHDEPAPTASPTAAPAPSGKPGLSVPYTEPVDLTTSRAWSGVDPAGHLFVALQTGADTAQRVIYGFPLKAVDHLLYQAPGATRAVRVEATGADKNRSAFPAQAITWSSDGTRVAAQLAWTRRDQAYHLQVAVNHQGTEYQLEGNAMPLARGNTPLHVLPLFHPPALDFTLLAANGATNLRGRIRAGPFTLHPGKGLSNKVRVELKDASGKRVKEETITHDGKGTGDFTLTLPLGGISTGNRFTLSATAELGPVLGRLEVEQAFDR